MFNNFILLLLVGILGLYFLKGVDLPIFHLHWCMFTGSPFYDTDIIWVMSENFFTTAPNFYFTPGTGIKIYHVDTLIPGTVNL